MKSAMNVQVAIWAILILSVGSYPSTDVQTQQGLLRGIVLTSERSGRDFFGFMGIPYAKPPIGDLRFKAPQPPDSWAGIKYAIIEGSVCPQVNEFTKNTEGDEDCLFLNVYTPKLPNGSDDTLIPVMVSIHGGAFSFGSGNRVIQGPDYLVDAGVVVVTINYRLGLLGFLSLQNAKVPGNNGMKDQVMAMKWVQQNIAQFGGNPNSVTIFGISAGGASVNLHMLSPMSRGLFHRAISQSGSAFMPWAVASGKTSLNLAIEAAQIMGSNATTPEELWHEFKNASLQQLWPVVRQMRSFRPTKDTMANEGEVFLPDDPKILVNTGHLETMPFMAGFTSNEGIVLIQGLGKNYRLLISTTEMLVRNYLRAESGTTIESIREAISKLEEFYFNGLTASNATLLQTLNFISDATFVHGVYCAVVKQIQVSTYPVYLYQFSFSGNMSLYKEFYGYRNLPGASHADDVPHIYRTSFHNRSFVEGSPEFVTSQRMVTMWTNFAKTGNPTPVPDPLLQNITWTPVTQTEIPALDINLDLSIQHNLRNGSIGFWEEFYKNYTTHALCAQHEEDTLVAIRNGALRGTILTSRNNRKFYAFMGIPYATPPIGNLRFKSPLPARNWEGLRDATKEGSNCVQPVIFSTKAIQGDENCLFLNVFTPQISRHALKPVMVWIHGGAYYFGSGDRNFGGPYYLIDGDVVVVTMNYRLNVFGFLNLEIEEVPGNVGLKDQVLALKWIQENILEFGGNPDKVTIVGESCGGASVHLHVLSPMSTGLFHYAISESGSGLNPWSFQEPNSSFSYDFGKKLGIVTENKNELLEKLQNCTVQEIFQVSQEYFSSGPTLEFHTPLVPTTDTKATPGNVFLPDTPLNLIKSEIFNKVPYITGINSQEGMMLISAIKKVINKTAQENVEVLRQEDFSIGEDPLIFEEVIKKIENFYFDDSTDYNTKFQQYIDFLGDIYFYNGVLCTARMHTLYSTAPVYTYQFSYSGQMNLFKKKFVDIELPGASHVDELQYIYGSPNITWNPDSTELKISERLVMLWTNFAKTGNPTPESDPSLENIIWPPVGKSQFPYLNIDTNLSIQYDPRKQNTEFWMQIFHNYSRNPLC